MWWQFNRGQIRAYGGSHCAIVGGSSQLSVTTPGDLKTYIGLTYYKEGSDKPIYTDVAGVSGYYLLPKLTENFKKNIGNSGADLVILVLDKVNPNYKDKKININFNSVPYNSEFKVAGFGYTIYDNDYSSSDVLRGTTMKTVYPSECSNYMDSSLEFCVSSLSNQPDKFSSVYLHDSGGPLYKEVDVGQFLLYGVVSRNANGTKFPFNTIFENLSQNYTWIHSIVKTLNQITIYNEDCDYAYKNSYDFFDAGRVMLITEPSEKGTFGDITAVFAIPPGTVKVINANSNLKYSIAGMENSSEYKQLGAGIIRIIRTGADSKGRDTCRAILY